MGGFSHSPANLEDDNKAEVAMVQKKKSRGSVNHRKALGQVPLHHTDRTEHIYI